MRRCRYVVVATFHVVTRTLDLGPSDEPREAVEDERSRDRDVQAGTGADHGNPVGESGWFGLDLGGGAGSAAAGLPAMIRNTRARRG
jgi:hypothetical protein